MSKQKGMGKVQSYIQTILLFFLWCTKRNWNSFVLILLIKINLHKIFVLIMRDIMNTYTMELTIKNKHQHVFFISFLRKLGVWEIISLHEIQFNNKINKILSSYKSCRLPIKKDVKILIHSAFASLLSCMET